MTPVDPCLGQNAWQNGPLFASQTIAPDFAKPHLISVAFMKMVYLSFV